MIVGLLVLMWAGAAVYYFRGRPETGSVDSIGHFRRQLRVLERTGPTLIDPAHRLGKHRDPVRDVAPPVAAVGLGRQFATSPGAAAARRRQTIKRRRDVFFGLLLGIGGSLFLGLVPGLRVMWLLAAGLVAVLALYVVVLLQIRNQAAERTMKVRFLDARRPQPEPALLYRRSAN